MTLVAPTAHTTKGVSTRLSRAAFRALAVAGTAGLPLLAAAPLAGWLADRLRTSSRPSAHEPGLPGRVLLIAVLLGQPPLRAILVHMHGAVSSEVVPAHQRQKREQQLLVSCLCGEQVAPVLARLGSPWCHECRDDPERRYRIIAESARALKADGEQPLAA
jgi:MFS family permease